MWAESPRHHLVAGSPDNALELTVTFVEPLGSHTHAYGAYPGVDDVLACELAGSSPIRGGDTLTLGIPPACCHLFDAEGRALPRVAP